MNVFTSKGIKNGISIVADWTAHICICGGVHYRDQPNERTIQPFVLVVIFCLHFHVLESPTQKKLKIPYIRVADGKILYCQRYIVCII